MGRAFEYRKARKMKRWGHMARTFTKLGKEIEIAVKAAGPDPSGNTRPSRQDDQLTQRLRDAARLVEIQLLDHIVLADGDYFSYSDEGRL